MADLRARRPDRLGRASGCTHRRDGVGCGTPRARRPGSPSDRHGPARGRRGLRPRAVLGRAALRSAPKRSPRSACWARRRPRSSASRSRARGSWRTCSRIPTSVSHRPATGLRQLAFQSVPARLAESLLELAERFGRMTTRGVRIDLRITHGQLAETISTTRETLTKAAGWLRSEEIAVLGQAGDLDPRSGSPSPTSPAASASCPVAATARSRWRDRQVRRSARRSRARRARRRARRAALAGSASRAARSERARSARPRAAR